VECGALPPLFAGSTRQGVLLAFAFSATDKSLGEIQRG